MEKNKIQNGFTLVEMIVVMAVFLFVIGAAVTIFVSILQQQKKILSEQEFLNQISYVEEYMSKALRAAKAATSSECISGGYIYELTRPVGSPLVYTGIKFLNQTNLDNSGNPTCQEFFWDTDGILKEEKNNNSATITPLTSSNLKINSVRFAINGADGSVSGQKCANNPNFCGAQTTDPLQPRVTILLNVQIAGDSESPKRTIQTTVSQRNLNIKQ
jgi:prepilin-type N-terminal cleavage/methylation domain-containing protein